jgi:hypothetical protein
MNAQYHVPIGCLLLLSSTFSMICMEPTPKMNLAFITGINAPEIYTIYPKEVGQFDELFTQTGNKLTNAYQQEDREIDDLCAEFYENNSDIRRRIGNTNDYIRATARLDQFFEAQKEKLDQKTAVLHEVRSNLQWALDTDDYRGVNGIEAIIEHTQRQAPLPGHPDAMFIGDIGRNLWPLVKPVYKELLEDHGYKVPLNNHRTWIELKKDAKQNKLLAQQHQKRLTQPSQIGRSCTKIKYKK